jgi:hypothetical protein
MRVCSGASSGELVRAERVVRGDDGFSYIETKSVDGRVFIPTKTREDLPVVAPEYDTVALISCLPVSCCRMSGGCGTDVLRQGHSSAHSSPEASASLTTVDRFTQQNEAYQALLAVVASKLKLCREIVSHLDANGDGIMQVEVRRVHLVRLGTRLECLLCSMRSGTSHCDIGTGHRDTGTEYCTLGVKCHRDEVLRCRCVSEMTYCGAGTKTPGQAFRSRNAPHPAARDQLK